MKRVFQGNSSGSSNAGRSWVIKTMAVLFTHDDNEESFELSLSYQSRVPLLTTPQTQFPLSNAKKLQVPPPPAQKKKTKKLPLLHFWLFCTSVHSSASSKLGGGQFFNVKICTSVKICTPAWSAHAPLRVLRHLEVLLHLANVGLGADAHWIGARTLSRSRHFTCDYHLCTQRCSCAIIIAPHMLSFWCNPQLRCPHCFCFIIRCVCLKSFQMSFFATAWKCS